MDCELGNVEGIRFLDRHGEKFLMAAAGRRESKRPSQSFAAAKERQYQDTR